MRIISRCNPQSLQGKSAAKGNERGPVGNSENASVRLVEQGSNIKVSRGRVMKTMRKSALALSAAMLGVPALAADMPQGKEFFEAEAHDWSGFHIGVGGGAASVVHDVFLFVPIFDGIGGEGVFGEITAGYDTLISDRLLLGGFASFRFGNAETEGSLTLGGGRLGILLSPQTLAYGVFGWTNQNFDLSTSFGFDGDWDVDGYFVGGGIETVWRGNWTLKGEYRFNQYEGEDFGIPIIEVETSVHSFHATLNYNFNDGRGPQVDPATFAPVGYEWTGFKGGIAGGAGAVNHELGVDVPVFGGVAVGFDGIGGEGLLGEIGIGYDYAFASSWVAGIGADYRWSNIETDITVIASIDITADSAFDIYGRLGYLVSENVLVYGLAGYSWQNFDVSVVGFEWDLDGYTLGAGIETAISDRWTAKVEYRYAQYEDFDLSSALGGPSGAATLEPSMQTVRAGLTYRFF